MSRHQFRGGTIRTTAELEMDQSRLCGTGGPAFPRLYWQVDLSLLPTRTLHIDYAFRSLQAQLLAPRGQKIAETPILPLNTVLRGYETTPRSECPCLEFPQDPHRIETIERHWENGFLKLQLHAQLLVEEHGLMDAHAESSRPKLWGLRGIYILNLQEELHIPRSHWVKHVLPGLGYGQVHVLEFPAAPLDSCKALDHSFKALQQATEQHRLGFYDEAVGKCRIALDPFFDNVLLDPKNPDSRRIPVLKKSWETKLGNATYTWLDTTLTALKGAANVTHHSPNNHYGQLESQMLLAITTAVLAYIARATSPDPNQ